ncbi:MAG: PEP-CTERM sorting domain-containing protein [Sphingomonadaceae bacterium]|nr:PEP-CTERM sorting domain-containing protein [Sphingomonadaceae bacterium]
MSGRGSLSILVSLLAAAPAAAQSDSAVVPEPSGLVLLGMGLAGVVIGRAMARRRPGE